MNPAGESAGNLVVKQLAISFKGIPNNFIGNKQPGYTGYTRKS